MGNTKSYLEGTRIQDLRGMKFGKLTVIEFDWDRYKDEKNKRHSGEIKQIKKYWKCECECGKNVSVAGSHLGSGHTNSCGLCYTFEDWCKDNNHQDYLDLWDYELNDKKPNEVSYGSNKKYWFKCRRGIHDSELKSICVYTRDVNCKISCDKCNSIGQYLLDTYGNLDMWSENNTVDPFEISKSHNKKTVKLICPDCKKYKDIMFYSFIYYGLGCECGDGNSYPNKFMINLLTQLNIAFETEYSPHWIKPRRYDFYIPSKNLIIEMDGALGHGNKIHSKSNITLDETLEIDNYKDTKARLYDLEVVRIDCLESELEYIKYIILNSKLNIILNMKNIDWLKCHEFSNSNIIKKVCDMWMSRSYTRTDDIANHINISRDSVLRYLKKGALCNWCDYDSKEEKRKTASKHGMLRGGKHIEAYKDDELVYSFISIGEIDRISHIKLGIKVGKTIARSVCDGKRKQYKGYTFKYVE